MTRSISEFLGAYSAPRLTVSVTTRADLLAEVARVSAQYEAKKVNSEALNGGGEHLIAEMERLTAEIRDSEFEFEFQAVSRGEYDRLISSCPPSPSQKKEGFQFNPDTFPEVLISACSVEPTITIDEARSLTEALTESQFRKLWQTALAVNVGDDSAPKFVTRSRLADQVETSSDTPLNTASPDPSSTGE